jgi:glutathione-independent formaldehyde dehydrogenase
MKALVYRGPKDVRIETVPDPKIEEPTDCLVKITSTNICGSDLHMYEGRTSVEEGKVLGHENLGVVTEVGEAVRKVKAGDLVCLPFNISCGFCENCTRGYTGFCLTMNPGNAGAAYGYAGMGPYQGGQAEFLRVPYADFNCLVLPEGAEEHEDDYVMLADIWPTGYHATELAGLLPGESVVIYGAGPVGLFAAYSALLKGASGVFVVDRLKDRLKLVEEIGATPIDDSEGSPVEQLKEMTDGKGTDKGCECVGYQAHDVEGEEHTNVTLNNLVESVKPTGRIGIVGVFPSEDPKSKDKFEKEGHIVFNIGEFFEKGLSMGSGQCNVKAYNQHLANLIASGKAKPSFLVSHELSLDEAPEAYKHFDNREDGWTKVVLKPDAAKVAGKLDASEKTKRAATAKHGHAKRATAAD